MARIAFTGPGRDHLGNFIDRNTLVEFAHSKGHLVTSRVDSRTTVLVASRSNTQKAADARARGLTVVEYPQWLAENGWVARAGGANSPTGRATNRSNPHAAQSFSPTGARFVGTVRPETPSVGDVWQPGGEGQAWVYSMNRDGSRAWERVPSPGDVDEWEDAEAGNVFAPRGPQLWVNQLPPESAEDLMNGDRFHITYHAVEGENHLPDEGARLVEKVSAFQWENGRWGCTSALGLTWVEFYIRRWQRFGMAGNDRVARLDGIRGSVLRDFVRVWYRDKWDAWCAAEAEAIREEHRRARERAPRWNVLRPDREIDL